MLQGCKQRPSTWPGFPRGPRAGPTDALVFHRSAAKGTTNVTKADRRVEIVDAQRSGADTPKTSTLSSTAQTQAQLASDARCLPRASADV